MERIKKYYGLTPSGREELERLETKLWGSGKPWKYLSQREIDQYYDLRGCEGVDASARKYPSGGFRKNLQIFLEKGWVRPLEVGTIDSLLSRLRSQDQGETGSSVGGTRYFPRGIYRAIEIYSKMARELPVSDSDLDYTLDWLSKNISIGIRVFSTEEYERLLGEARRARSGTRSDKVIAIDSLIGRLHSQLISSRESLETSSPGTTVSLILDKLEKGEV